MSDRPEWMTPMDERILELMAKTRRVKVDGLWLPPKSIMLALPADRSYVTTRLKELERMGFVKSDGDGWYLITEAGYQYIQSGVP